MPVVLALTNGLTVAAAAVVAVVVVLVLILLVIGLERRRRNRRFSKRLARYERRRSPGEGQVLNPEDRPRPL
jgi:Flp pilus assembly protein TadB